MATWTDPNGTLHETYSGSIFVRDEYLGTFHYDSGDAAYGWNRAGLAFFCPTCGEIWARVVAANASGRPQEFSVLRAHCEQHKDPWDIPGSILRESFANRLGDLPFPALRRELTLHLNYYEKNHD